MCASVCLSVLYCIFTLKGSVVVLLACLLVMCFMLFVLFKVPEGVLLYC